MNVRPIAVIGVGTLLFSDQGLGLQVVRALGSENLPNHVECIEAGMSGFNLIPWMDEREKVIFVSALPSGSAPGTIHRFLPSELEALLPPQSEFEIECRKAPGEGDEFSEDERIYLADKKVLIETIELAEYLGITPEIVIIGAEPVSTEPGSGLSNLIQKKIPAIVKKVKEEINTGKIGKTT